MTNTSSRPRRRGSKRNQNGVVPEPVQERAAPTVDALIEATIRILDESDEPSVRVDEILDVTGVSRGSLYHHFGDRDGLVDAARAVQFSRFIDGDIEAVRAAFEGAEDATEFARRLRAITADTQRPERIDRRLRRLEIIAATRTRPRLAEALAETQDRLTNAFVEIVEQAQARGWVHAGLDPRAVAVFIQAYSLGRAVSDIDANPVSGQMWESLINHVAESALLTGTAGAVASHNGE